MPTNKWILPEGVEDILPEQAYWLEIKRREVVDTLKQLVSLGENIDYQKQHIENIKNITGEERIFK